MVLACRYFRHSFFRPASEEEDDATSRNATCSITELTRRNESALSNIQPIRSNYATTSRATKLPSSNSEFLIYYQNTGGINTTISKYAQACSDGSYDMYAFVETWLNSNTLSSQIFSDNFTTYRLDRNATNSNKSSGGGVIAAIKSSFNSRQLFPPDCQSLEQLWLAVTFVNRTLCTYASYIYHLINPRTM